MLQGIRVVELATEIAGPYCTKLFADAGADVTRVEPPGGDPLREHLGGELFRYLQLGKRLVTGDALQLAGQADVFVVDHAVDLDALSAANPSLVVVTITPFGTDGPWRDRPASELTVQAAGGSTGWRGHPDGPPIAIAGRVGEWMAGTYAAVAGLAAHWGVRHGAPARHVDVSVLETVAIVMTNSPVAMADFMGWPPVSRPARLFQVPSVEPTADGYVAVTTNTAQQFWDLNVLMGHPELNDDDDLRVQQSRFRRRDEYLPLLHDWTTSHTTDEVVDACADFRVPCGPVLDAGSIRDFSHFVERGVYRQGRPRPPYRIHGLEPFDPPALPPVPDPSDDADRLPLAGVRVVDLTMWWAGPSNPHVLAALGADVIKVESCSHCDPSRLINPHPPTEEQWWEHGPVFHTVATNRRGITIELGDPRGIAVLERLLADADILVENYTPRVMENFGLTWERLHAINPKLLVVRMPAFGLDGPWRDRTGFAQTMEAISGIAFRTGEPDRPPVLPLGVCDPMGGVHAAFGTLAALVQRARDGAGRLVEATMVEAALNVAVEALLHHDATGEVLTRMGNRDVTVAPQGIYQCAGDDAWVAVTVKDDAQWSALVALLDEPGLATTELATAAGRRAAHDRIDAHLSEWFARKEPGKIVELLVERDIPAAEVVLARDAYFNPQLQHRGFFETEQHPITGTHVLGFTVPFRMTGVDTWIRRTSPTLGQHNGEVLAELGYSEAEITELRAAGVIGDRVTGS